MDNLFTGDTLTQDTQVDCDICIVGSGAGGGILAAGLVAQGLDVVMLESGGWNTRESFTLHERDAMSEMYQESAGRVTKDMAISILQGHTAGGGTAINWTSIFEIPDRIADHWWQRFGLEGLDSRSLHQHYVEVERILSIQEWPLEYANPNNRVLVDGCKALGWDVGPMRRNVKGCMNTGYCGLGCPVDAKQSGFVTVLPEAMRQGMRLYTNVHAHRYVVEAGRIVAVEGRVLRSRHAVADGPSVTVRAKVFVNSAGAINGPGLLLRSGLDSGGRCGQRTFLHPVLASLAVFEDPIQPWTGAPQSCHSHRFHDRGEDKVGYFLESAPLQPMLAAVSLKVMGDQHRQFMEQLGHTSALLALCIDGLVRGDDGGTVSLKSDGRPVLDYSFSPAMVEAFRHSQEQMVRVQFAGGAKEVRTTHPDPLVLKSLADVPKINDLRFGALEHSVFTAHQMGGCAMGANRGQSIVNPDLRHWDVDNLFVVDGSVLPSSLGVNPSMSIYALAHRAREVVAAAV